MALAGWWSNLLESPPSGWVRSGQIQHVENHCPLRLCGEFSQLKAAEARAPCKDAQSLPRLDCLLNYVSFNVIIWQEKELWIFNIPVIIMRDKFRCRIKRWANLSASRIRTHSSPVGEETFALRPWNSSRSFSPRVRCSYSWAWTRHSNLSISFIQRPSGVLPYS